MAKNLTRINFLYEDGTTLILDAKENKGVGELFYKNLMKNTALKWRIEKSTVSVKKSFMSKLKQFLTL